MGVFLVINDDWNVPIVLIFTSICNDVGVLQVINDDWNATCCFSFFISICNDVGVS